MSGATCAASAGAALADPLVNSYGWHGPTGGSTGNVGTGNFMTAFGDGFLAGNVTGGTEPISVNFYLNSITRLRDGTAASGSVSLASVNFGTPNGPPNVRTTIAFSNLSPGEVIAYSFHADAYDAAGQSAGFSFDGFIGRQG